MTTDSPLLEIGDSFHTKGPCIYTITDIQDNKYILTASTSDKILDVIIGILDLRVLEGKAIVLGKNLADPVRAEVTKTVMLNELTEFFSDKSTAKESEEVPEEKSKNFFSYDDL